MLCAYDVGDVATLRQRRQRQRTWMVEATLGPLQNLLRCVVLAMVFKSARSSRRSLNERRCTTPKKKRTKEPATENKTISFHTHHVGLQFGPFVSTIVTTPHHVKFNASFVLLFHPACATRDWRRCATTYTQNRPTHIHPSPPWGESRKTS